MLDQIFGILENWWPFFFAAFLLFSVNEAIKKLFPKPDEKRSHAIIWVLLPIWPVLFGSLFGAWAGASIAAGLRNVHLAGAIYYGAAGALAIYLRDCWRTALKYKFKVVEEPTEPDNTES